MLVEPRMRWAALLLMIPLGATVCTGETDVGDPACAFDETGCIPSELVIDVRTGTEPPTAELRASSPTQSWSQEGTLGGIGDIESEPGRIAPRVELSLAGDVELAELQILRVRSDGGLEALERLELGPARQVVRLDNGERYVLQVRLRPPGGVFSFLTVVP